VSTHCCKRPTPRPPHHMNTVELVPSSTGQRLVKGVNWCGARTHHWMRAPHVARTTTCERRAKGGRAAESICLIIVMCIYMGTHHAPRVRVGMSCGGSHPVMRACTAPVHPFDQLLTGTRRYQLYSGRVIRQARSWPFTTMCRPTRRQGVIVLGSRFKIAI
jgi:hypothetical protein